MTIAIFVAAVLSYGIVTTTNHGWQYVLGLGELVLYDGHILVVCIVCMYILILHHRLSAIN